MKSSSHPTFRLHWRRISFAAVPPFHPVHGHRKRNEPCVDVRGQKFQITTNALAGNRWFSLGASEPGHFVYRGLRDSKPLSNLCNSQDLKWLRRLIGSSREFHFVHHICCSSNSALAFAMDAVIALLPPTVPMLTFVASWSVSSRRLECRSLAYQSLGALRPPQQSGATKIEFATDLYDR